MKPFDTEVEMAERLADLARSFDDSFSKPIREHEKVEQVLLAIRVGEMPFAIRLTEVAGVHACRKIAPLPDSTQELLGIAGIRGKLFGVYRLSTLLGCAPVDGHPRWLLLASSDDQIAFAVEEIEAYLQVANADLYSAHSEGTAEEHVRHVVKKGTEMRGILNIPSILSMIARRTGVAMQEQGQ